MRAKRNSISVHIMLYFISAIILPVLILAILMQSFYERSVLSIVKTDGMNAINLINYNLNQQFKNYENLTYFIGRDAQIKELSEITADQYNTDAQTKKNIYKLLNYYRSCEEDVIRIVVAFENAMVINTDTEDSNSADQQGQSWYMECKQNGDVWHIRTYADNEQIYQGIDPVNMRMITANRPLYNSSGSYIGAVSVEMHSQILKKSMSNVLSRNGSYVYVLNDKDQVIYSPIVGSVPKADSRKEFIEVRTYNKRNDWTIVGMIPTSSYMEGIRTFQRVLLITVMVIVIIMIVFTLRFSKGIVKPINHLRKLMKQAEKGDLTVRFSEKSPEEIQDLGENFNFMIERLDINVKQVYIEQKAKRRAEIEALHANIKPHFLYNTLDTIHWMAKSYHADDIVETVDALSSLFRIALSKGSEIIPFSQEITHVTSYLKIQKVRYEDMFSYQIHVTEDCKSLMVQKLILQPLVENAIYHGIKECSHLGHITINVWREKDAIYMAVEDDGSGMSDTRLNEVRGSLKNFKASPTGAYGVVNVHQRLFLSYGSPYGLYLESNENSGTTALIVHPVI